jgi:hypothetical protein
MRWLEPRNSRLKRRKPHRVCLREVQPLESRLLLAFLPISFQLSDPGNQFQNVPTTLNQTLSLAAQIMSNLILTPPGSPTQVQIVFKPSPTVTRPIATTPIYFPRVGWRDSTPLQTLRSEGQSTIEIDAPFNYFNDPNNPLYVGVGSQVPAGKTDFLSALLRESFHGLGFWGFADSSGNYPVGPDGTFSSVLDHWINYQNGKPFFTGPRGQDANSASAVPFDNVQSGDPSVADDFSGDGSVPINFYFLAVANDLMARNLPTGVRRLPSALDASIVHDVSIGTGEFTHEGLLVPPGASQLTAVFTIVGPQPDPQGQGPIVFNATTLDGTAIAGTDYTATSVNNVALSADTLTGSITVPILKNSPAQAGKTFYLVLSDSGGITQDEIPVTFPNAPSTPHLEAASDSGPSNSDDYTNVTSPVFDIAHADPNVTVQLLRKLSGAPDTSYVVVGAQVGPGAITDSTLASLTPPDGVYSYAAREADATGVISPVSAALTVTIATMVGPVSRPVLDPASDSGVAGDDITNVVSPVFDTSGAEAKATVQLLRKLASDPGPFSVVVGSFTTTAGGAVMVTDTNLSTLSNPDAVYAYAVRQVDLAGNISTISQPLTVTILTAKPVTPSAPILEASSDSGASSSDDYTNVTHPIFDVNTAAGADTVQLLRNGVVAGTRTGPGPITDTTLASLSPPDGTYSFTSKQIDVAGNTSTPSAPLSVTIDTMPPATPPAPALAGGGTVTTNTRPLLIGKTEPGARVELLLDPSGSIIATVTAAAQTGAYQVQPPAPLPVGMSTFRVQAVDLTGNVSGASAPTTITINMRNRVVAPLADYNGDGRSEIGVYGPYGPGGIGRIAVQESGGGAINMPFGGPLDTPVVGDFDGDGKTDIGVYGPYGPNGANRFAILLSGGGAIVQTFGNPLDKPAIGDFNGDGKIDLGVYGPYGPNGNNRLLVMLSGGGTMNATIGGPLDTFVPGDFDGDGKTDVAVYGPYGPNGLNRIAALLSGSGAIVKSFGGPLDQFVSGDFNGDGKTDIGVFGPYGPNGLNRLAVFLSGGGAVVQNIGGPLDHFVSGDFDGDGKTDIAVYGPYGPGGIGRIAVLESGGGAINMPFGGPKDIPLPPPIGISIVTTSAFAGLRVNPVLAPGALPQVTEPSARAIGLSGGRAEMAASPARSHIEDIVFLVPAASSQVQAPTELLPSAAEHRRTVMLNDLSIENLAKTEDR